MKTNKIPFINTQIKIVNNLLDGSKKYQRKIASEIGREESTISRALDYLVRGKVIIKEKKDVVGGKRNKGTYPAKICYLSYDIDDGAHILNFFKIVLSQQDIKKSDEIDIIKNLQQTKKIRELLCRKYFSLIDISIIMFDLMIKDNYNLMLTRTVEFQQHLSKECIPHVYNELKEFVKKPESTNGYKVNLMYYLGCSPTFLKILLKNEPSDLATKYSDIYFNPNNALFIKCYNFSIHDPIFKDFKDLYFNNFLCLLIDTIFSESVHIDTIEGNALQDSLDFKTNIIDQSSTATLITNLINRVAENSRYNNQMFYPPDYHKIFE